MNRISIIKCKITSNYCFMNVTDFPTKKNNDTGNIIDLKCSTERSNSLLITKQTTLFHISFLEGVNK